MRRSKRSTVASRSAAFRRSLLGLLAGLGVLVAGLVVPGPVRAQGSGPEPSELSDDQRVYDQTSTSLTVEQRADLAERLDDLAQLGADAVVVVRELDATPAETLEQVEALQQSWAEQTGASADTAVAILINRNPGDPHDARAGVFVGRTYHDGNVPPGEQRAIVDKALIPPLRDGDVHASLVAGIGRLARSIEHGPPQNAFDRWASDAGGSWLPWVGVGIAGAGLAGAWVLHRRRHTTDRPTPPPTTTRPGELAPAVAGALVAGGPQASALPATLLDLARRHALAIEPEPDDQTGGDPTVQLRLLDRTQVDDGAETEVWNELEARAAAGVVPSEQLLKLAQSHQPFRDTIEARLRGEGWIAPGARARRAWLIVIALAAVMLAVPALIVAAAGEQLLMLVPTVALIATGGLALVAAALHSPLSTRGQDAALPWIAYRQGLEGAARDDTVPLDLDTVVADVVAMNLGTKMAKRIEALDRSGQPLAVFASSTSGAGPGSHDHDAIVGFPWWVAFCGVAVPSGGPGSGAAGSTVSGVGAAGGGGAAGST